MYQSGRAGDEAKKRKSPTKSGRVGITAFSNISNMRRCVSSDIQTLRSSLKRRGTAEFF